MGKKKHKIKAKRREMVKNMSPSTTCVTHGVGNIWALTPALTLVLTVQLLPLVVQVLLSQVLNVQKPLDNLVHGAIYEGQGQVPQGAVGQALLEGAAKARSTTPMRPHAHHKRVDATSGSVVLSHPLQMIRPAYLGRSLTKAWSSDNR